MTSPRIAFLGLGIMGSGMARRLVGAGFPVTVFNRNPARAESLAAAGARVAASPREAVVGADIVISMVADDSASRALWSGENGALAGVQPGTLLVECSTLTLGWVRELGERAQAQQCELVDAPVTGSRLAAANGELNFMVGAGEAALTRLRPVLAPMSRSITHFGGPGSGALVKLVNNFLCGVQVVAFAEALAWLERSGVDRAPAIAFLNDAAPGSPIQKMMTPRMTTPDFTPNFYLRLMTKDLGYAADAAAGEGVTLETAKAALVQFRRAIEAGHGDQDMAAVVEPLRKSGTADF